MLVAVLCSSFEDWSNFFRNRSFTLFKKNRDLRERFDSVAVSESISSSIRWQTCHIRVSPYLFSTFHQISTLEKTTFCQCSILSGLKSQRPICVSPYSFAAHFTSSKVRSDFQICFSPGFPMQSRQARSDLLHLHIPFWHHFKTIGRTEMADVKQTQKMIPFTCEVSLCQYVCELVLGVSVFDLDLGVQIDSIKQPIKSNSVGSGNVGGSFSARVPRSSTEVRRVFVHHVLEDEVDGQMEGQGDQREDGEEEEVNWEVNWGVEERQQSDTTDDTCMDGVSADPNLSHACACIRGENTTCEVWCSHRIGCSRQLSAVNDPTLTNLKNLESRHVWDFVKRRHSQRVSPFYRVVVYISSVVDFHVNCH